MKSLLSYAAIILFLSAPSALDDVRRNFTGISSLEEANTFIDRLKYEGSLESRGYAASMNIIKSHYVKFPFTKLKYFKKGKHALDELIRAHPDNIEIRHLRFFMQKQVPKFLGYNGHIDQDFTLIIRGIERDSLSDELRSIILRNLLEVDNLSNEERERLNKFLDRS
jgi:hypothetical protein